MLFKKIMFLWSLLGILTQCGFKPIYYSHRNQEYLPLGQIRIATIPDRSGQMLKDKLSTLLSVDQQDRDKIYELRCQMIYTQRDLAMLKDASTSRMETILTVNFVLVDILSGKTVYEGKEVSNADYNILAASPYANIVTEESARHNLIDDVAQNIKLQLAMYLTHKNSKKNEDRSL